MAIEKILVVDDEPIIRKSFEELLRPKRYGVGTAGTLHDAERLLKRDTFDLLFLDVRLPDGDGTDLLERISHLPHRPMTIVMSGFGTIETAVACTSKTITIEVIGDNKRESDEVFYLDLFNNSSNSVFTKNRGIGTILNDD